MDVFDDYVGAGGSRAEEVGTGYQSCDDESDGGEETEDILGADDRGVHGGGFVHSLGTGILGRSM